MSNWQAPRRLLGRGSWLETARIADVLRKETVGGAVLLVAAVSALVWANSPWSAGYFSLRDVQVGPQALHLRLTLGEWAADGLLAIFFFVAGLELKREFVAGDLRDPARAAVPVATAVSGVLVPALLYTAVNLGGSGDITGWAIPTATDIAFALAVLAIIGSHLPSALRTFLLTLAVVDDLLAITIIATFYTHDLQVAPLLLALVPLALFTIAVQRHIRSWWLLMPLAATTWALVHASGVHATVAGILLGFAVPVIRQSAGEGPGLAEHFEHQWRPLSASVAVPVFAFLAAGVTVGGASGLSSALRDPVAIGILVGLVVGKPFGVLGATWLVARFTRAELDADLAWWDVLGLAMLAVTADGKTWSQGGLSVEPRALASAPDGSQVLATTDQGLLSSTDGGKTWAPPTSAPPLFLTAWADSKTVVGVTTQGGLAISTDAGLTWKADLATVTSGQALSASRDKAGVLEILVVTDTGVLQSRDEGATLSELKS